MGEIETTLKHHGYSLGNYVGKGATSDCFTVKSLNFKNVDFACKVIHLLPGEYSRTVHRHFEQEVSLLTKLDHQNIIRCYDFFEDGANLYIIMEYCAMGNLSSLIKRNHPSLLHNFNEYAFQIISALAYCHEVGVAHLDIKPANIFITKYNSLRLSDFGSSKAFTQDETVKAKIGTTYFMAPEIGMKAYDPFKADIYSFGMTLLFCHQHISFNEVQKQENFYQFFLDKCANTGPFEKIIRSCISINPQERPTAMEIRDMISKIVASEKIIHFQTQNALGSDAHPLQTSSLMRVNPRLSKVRKTFSMKIIHPTIANHPYTRIKHHLSLQIQV